MSIALRVQLCSLALSLILVSIATPQSQPSSVPAPPQSSSESAVRAMAEEYFALYAAKDLDGLMSLWSKQSPDLESRKQEIQKLFASYEKIEVKSLAVLRVTIAGEKARLRVNVEINAVEAKTGKPAAGFGLRKQVMEFVKEDSGWRVWREESAYENLAAALAATATEKERDALLADEKDLRSAELSRALNAQGVRYATRSLYPQAIDIFQIERSVAEKIGDQPGLVDALHNIGLAHSYQGVYESALKSLQASLQLAEAIRDKYRMARALNGLGITYQSQGHFSLAIESYRKSLEIAQAQGNKIAIAAALGSLGNIYITQSNYSSAAEFYQKSLANYREAGGNAGQAGEARILHSLGNIQYYQGNLDLALKFFQESLSLKEKVGNSEEQARTLDAIGTIYLSRGAYKLAEEFYRKSLALFEAADAKEEIASSYITLGDLYLAQGNHTMALEYYHKSLEMSEAIGAMKHAGDSLNSLTEVYLIQGKPAQALESAGRAAEIAEQLGSLDMLWTAFARAGKAHRQLARPAQARQAFEKAINAIETMRTQAVGGERETQGFLASKVTPYHELIGLLIDQNQPGEALTYAERSKARSLLDVLQSGKVDIHRSLTDVEQEQERKLKEEITSLNVRLTRATQADKPDERRISELKPQLEKARLNYEAFQTTLYTMRPELKIHRGAAPIISAEELTALMLDAASALLEYVVTEDVTYLFVVTKAPGRPAAETQVFTLPIKQAELAKRAESFRDQLARRDLGYRATARQLYDLLLKPAQALLCGKTSLVIAPDDKLWELPFQALLADGDRYVIESSAVSYAPSLTVLREMKAERARRLTDPAAFTLLAVGNPAVGQETIGRATLTMRGGKLDPLPEAEQEVKALGQLYSAEHSKVYIGAEASEDRVKAEAGQARILHFATHATLNNASPMYSYLALAQGDVNEDGLLEAWELMQMDLHADLAVLSACETARGRYGVGEGVIGLTWALFVAGVPSTVVSQWKVESASTRDLMLNFHRQLLAPAAKAKVTKAEALRQAALKVMKNPETSHPFYWAGFVLVGDGGSGATTRP
jgi:CHAT domain-containing protein/tetratricopeptide (TPR) repeat protein